MTCTMDSLHLNFETFFVLFLSFFIISLCLAFFLVFFVSFSIAPSSHLHILRQIDTANFSIFLFQLLFLHFICLNHTIKYHLTVTFRFIDHVHATFDWLIFIFFLFAHSSHSHLLFCSILSGQTFSIHFNFHKIIFMTQKKYYFNLCFFRLFTL